MKKYSEISDPGCRPLTFNALPELHYPDALNVAEVLIEGSFSRGWAARTAFHHPEGSLAFQEVALQSHRYAGALRQCGLRRGDRVLIRLHDTPELIYAMLAVWAVGAVAVPTYVQLKAKDLIYRAANAGCVMAIVGADLLGEFQSVPVSVDALRTTLVVGGAADGMRSMEALLPGDVAERTYEKTGVDEVALLIYTSGSTGNPKGTVHSHRDLLAICDSYCRYCVKMTEDDVIAGPPSMPFALALGFHFLFTMRFGASAYLDPDKSVERLASVLNKHKVTILVAVPTYYNRFLQHVRQHRLHFPSLRQTLCGGEPLSDVLEDAWRAELKLPLVQFLGTTELLHIFLAIRLGEDEPRAGAIGRAVPGYEVTVRHPETLEPVACGEKGLLAACGPTGTHYWKAPEQQAKAVRGGWNVVQDLVWCDRDGYIHYVARNDDMIISGGHNIAPSEVEKVLMRHPEVVECACVGAPDPSGSRSSIVKAFVVLRPAIPADDARKRELQDFFKREGPPYMYPREIEFMDVLPKTMSGKILRNELKNRQPEK